VLFMQIACSAVAIPVAGRKFFAGQLERQKRNVLCTTLGSPLNNAWQLRVISSKARATQRAVSIVRCLLCDLFNFRPKKFSTFFDKGIRFTQTRQSSKSTVRSIIQSNIKLFAFEAIRNARARNARLPG